MYILNESKQVGILYHLTNYEGLKHILENNVLESNNGYNYVSFTRNKRYSYISGTEKFFICRIFIDGNKLSDNYKIEQYADKNPYVSGNRFEAEERVKSPIKNIVKYIEYIEFFEKRIDKVDSAIKFLLKKYKIKTNITLPSKVNIDINGFYKNGNRVYKFNEKNIYDIYFKYIDRSKYDDIDKGWLKSQNINTFIYEINLNNFDIIFVNEKEMEVLVRAKNTKLYEYLFRQLKKFKLKKYNYK